MLSRVTVWVISHAGHTLLITLVAVAGAAALGTHAFGRLGVGGFYAAGDESTRAEAAIDRLFPVGPPNLVLVARADGPVDEAAAGVDGRELTARLARAGGVEQAVSYWSADDPGLRSADGRSALVLARIRGDEDQRKATLLRIFPELDGRHGSLEVAVGGQLASEREATERSREDLHRLELIASPLVGLLLVLVFRNVWAGAFALAIGGTAIAAVSATLWALSEFTRVSTYAVNIATALSLGLAVDYGLFMVSRFREARAGGADVPIAVLEMNRTAGRTVLVSALTVVLCLCSLLIVPLYYFRSVALSAIAVVVLSALAAVLLMPALLALFGHRVGTGRARAGRHSRRGPGAWFRVAHAVMRRPVLLTVLALALLGVLAAPTLGVRFTLPDVSVLPADGATAQVARTLGTQFGALPVDATYAVSPAGSLPTSATAALAGRISALPAVGRVESAAGVFRHGAATGTTPATAGYRAGAASWMTVVLAVPPQSQDATTAVAAIRRLTGPAGMLVGGPTAHLIDTKATLGRALPIVVGWLALSTIGVLLLFTASVLIPFKAILLSLLSLAATFGGMVWIFQNGRLTWLIGDYQSNGALEITTPLVVVAIAFGLAMDYELFLISRIKEEYGATGDNAGSVAVGLQRSGRVVSAAALLFVLVMLAFSASALSIVKLVGVGLALAVLLDVTVVRAVLVPAIMKMAGTANWWGPGWLVRLHHRLGLAEFETAAPRAPAGGAPVPRHARASPPAPGSPPRPPEPGPGAPGRRPAAPPRSSRSGRHQPTRRHRTARQEATQWTVTTSSTPRSPTGSSEPSTSPVWPPRSHSP
jgi:RND superfamily putative drug exporter